MTALPILLAAMTITFPPAGKKLAYSDECYMIGAVPHGVTNLVVQGQAVDVYRTGAFATMLTLNEGTNTVAITFGTETTNHIFYVGAKPKPKPATPGTSPASTNKAPEKVWEKLEYAKDEPKPHPTGKSPSDIKVVVDAGHGGSDTGALSPHGYPEKDANLRVAREVVRALKAKGYQTIMTRDKDFFIPLHDRPKVAHTNDADAFISIHHNAPPATKDPLKYRYTTVYAWNPLGEQLAKTVDKRLGAALRDEIPDHGVQHANFAVTRNPEIPSCLVEVDFLTSPEGEEAVWDFRRRRRIGEAIAEGFADWCALTVEGKDAEPSEKAKEE